MFNVIKGCTGFKRMPHIIILETPNRIPLTPIRGREEGFIWSSQRKDAKAQLPTEREHPSFSPPQVWALCTGTESRGMAPISFFGNFLHCLSLFPILTPLFFLQISWIHTRKKEPWTLMERGEKEVSPPCILPDMGTFALSLGNYPQPLEIASDEVRE